MGMLATAAVNWYEPKTINLLIVLNLSLSIIMLKYVVTCIVYQLWIGQGSETLSIWTGNLSINLKSLKICLYSVHQIKGW